MKFTKSFFELIAMLNLYLSSGPQLGDVPFGGAPNGSPDIVTGGGGVWLVTGGDVTIGVEVACPLVGAIGVIGVDLCTKAKYPTAPARTTTNMTSTIFANPF